MDHFFKKTLFLVIIERHDSIHLRVTRLSTSHRITLINNLLAIRVFPSFIEHTRLLDSLVDRTISPGDLNN